LKAEASFQKQRSSVASASSTGLYVGVDVGAGRLHCVALNERLRVEEAAVLGAAEIAAFAAWAGRRGVRPLNNSAKDQVDFGRHIRRDGTLS
jgi:activator of 2-hydroxyglutaryl-CoA dehydratase